MSLYTASTDPMYQDLEQESTFKGVVGVDACTSLCTAKVAGSGGRSKPERLCAFCVCVLRVCIAACDHCDANVAALGGAE